MTLGRVARMTPNQPKTPAMAFRLDPDVKARLQALADEDGITLSEEIRAAIDVLLAMRERRPT